MRDDTQSRNEFELVIEKRNNVLNMEKWYDHLSSDTNTCHKFPATPFGRWIKVTCYLYLLLCVPMTPMITVPLDKYVSWHDYRLQNYLINHRALFFWCVPGCFSDQKRPLLPFFFFFFSLFFLMVLVFNSRNGKNSRSNI